MIKQGLIACIRFYQRVISSHTPPSCRFTPTCSSYAIEAIQRYGVVRGLGLAVWRILRCNPFGKYGYDPVPDLPPLFFRRKKASAGNQTSTESLQESPQPDSPIPTPPVSDTPPGGHHDEEYDHHHNG